MRATKLASAVKKPVGTRDQRTTKRSMTAKLYQNTARIGEIIPPAGLSLLIFQLGANPPLGCSNTAYFLAK